MGPNETGTGPVVADTFRDQQIKDPLLLAAILSALFRAQAGIDRLHRLRIAVENKQAGPPENRRARLGWVTQVVVVPVWFGRVISRAV
jgi:hypothetical protein